MATLSDIFTQGYAAGRDIARDYHAHGAALKQYGAAADDPQLFSALQNMELNRNQDARAGEQLKLNQNQDARQQQNQDFGVEDRESYKKRMAAIGAIQGIRQARDNGQDVGEAFDAVADLLIQTGTDPADIPEMRAKLVENPMILDTYMSTLDPGGTVTPVSGGGLTPAQQYKIDQDNEKVEKGREDVSGTIDTMRDLYQGLDENKGIQNTDASLPGRAIRALRSSWLGRTAGRAAGTKNEESRRTIEGLRPSLLVAIKSAEALGARMFDSNRDMEMWLSTVTDPSQPIGTVMALLDEFERKYGAATKDGGAGGGKVPTITSDDEYNSLPSGAVFIAPDGTTRRKP